MNKTWILAAAGIVAGNLTARAQTPPAGVLLNKISTTYRAMQSYSDIATWKMKLGEKDLTANINLAASKPNRFLLDVKGDKISTTIWSDGSILTGYRPDRKAYAKTKAPLRLIGSDILAGIDLPQVGSKIVTMLLEGTLLTADKDLAQGLGQAKATGPQGFQQGKLAYVISFPYTLDYEIKMYVTNDDLLVRRVVLFDRDGIMKSIESFESIEVDKPIPAETFTKTVPEGTKMVAVLPRLDPTALQPSGPPATDFAVETVDGKKVRLSDYKGKVVLLNFFFVT